MDFNSNYDVGHIQAGKRANQIYTSNYLMHLSIVQSSRLVCVSLDMHSKMTIAGTKEGTAAVAGHESRHQKRDRHRMTKLSSCETSLSVQKRAHPPQVCVLAPVG